MNFKIEAIEYYLPEKVIDNDFLVESCGIDKAFMSDKVGILERRIAAPDEPTSELAVKASKKLLERTKVDLNEIDLIVLCTQNPDYRLPTTACLVQDRLGLKKTCMGFDVNLGCSGFPYSLIIAGNFIKTGKAKKALLVMADEYSKIIDYSDKTTAPIFGDAGTAILLSGCEDKYGVVDSSFGTDGSGWDKLIVYNTGVVEDTSKSNFVFMDGLEIFKFATRVIPPTVADLLAKNSIGMSDIKKVVFHQANTYIIKELQKKMKITDEQLVIDMANYGNTVQSTIPIALKNLFDKDELKKGDLVLFSGYGVGLSWGNILYRYI